jgi:AraC-like DNA-binding protein
MQFYVHHIQNPALKPYILYILFNYCKGGTPPREITSYANTNICLGILKGKEVIEKENGIKTVIQKTNISSYISGLYVLPHRFIPEGELDEICIDFTPLGYYHFFPFPVKKYIFNEDILQESFGNKAHSVFEMIFSEKKLERRGTLIEKYLLHKIKTFENPVLSESLFHVHQTNGEIAIRDLAKRMNCNEKKLYRYYLTYFDITPQEYKRIVRFRHALKNLEQYKKNLTSLAYHCEYFDQSHLIKEVKKFTNLTPRKCLKQCISIDNTVLMNVR